MLSVRKVTFLGKPLYTHWAVYVGSGHVDGLNKKKNDEEIFHITGKPDFNDWKSTKIKDIKCLKISAEEGKTIAQTSASVLLITILSLSHTFKKRSREV